MRKYDNAKGWYNPYDFHFNTLIEDNFEKIKDECYNVLNQNLFKQHDQSEENENVKHKTKLAKKWDAFFIRDNEEWKDVETLVPITYNLLRSIREIQLQKRGRIYFSMIPPGAEIKPHVSDQNIGTRCRHQLCIETPNCDSELLYMDVEGTKRGWKVGKVLSFDDAYLHSVVNKTNERRIVLLYDSI